MKDNYGYPICLKGTTIELTAKQISLLLWGDIAKHGYKTKYESSYFYLVQNLRAHCPYCAIFLSSVCRGCPLVGCWDSLERPYRQWSNSQTVTDRTHAGYALLKVIKAAPDLLEEEKCL